ncbi:hypothetical protein, partial [Clostridium perfringens]
DAEPTFSKTPDLAELQHWTWVMGRAQQMMMEQGLDWFDAARLPDVADTPAAAQVRDFWHDSLILWQRFLDPAAAPPAPPAPPASEG